MSFKTVSYINGEYVSENRATISALDLGVLRGFGVFEVIRTHRGIPFHAIDHLERLRSSCSLLGLKLDLNNLTILKIFERLLKVNSLKEASIRIVITGGSSFDYITPSGQISVLIFATPLLSYPKHYYAEGIHAITFEAERFMPECKSLGYMSAVLGLQKAKQKNAQEAIYINRKNHVLEGTTCNFFGIKDGRIITPEEEILHGVTRDILLKLLEPNYPIERRVLPLEELFDLDEAFFTSTNKEVLPVVQIDQKSIGIGTVGPQTKKIMHLFEEYTKLPVWKLEKSMPTLA